MMNCWGICCVTIPKTVVIEMFSMPENNIVQQTPVDGGGAPCAIFLGKGLDYQILNNTALPQLVITELKYCTSICLKDATISATISSIPAVVFVTAEYTSGMCTKYMYKIYVVCMVHYVLDKTVVDKRIKC